MCHPVYQLLDRQFERVFEIQDAADAVIYISEYKDFGLNHDMFWAQFFGLFDRFVAKSRFFYGYTTMVDVVLVG